MTPSTRTKVILASRRRAAFTLIELLVVISIFVLLLAIAVPAFSSLLYSNDRTQAENQLTSALGGARMLAMSAESATDAAAVFAFEPGGRTIIYTCRIAGTLVDSDRSAGTGLAVERDVFVPVATTQPVSLPRYWNVRGLAPVASTDDTTDPTGLSQNGWYEQSSVRSLQADRANWVFPETGFYNKNVGAVNQGAESPRQTFMVRFAAGSGQIRRADRNTALVVLPVSDGTFRGGIPWSNYRLDRAEDQAIMVGRILADPSLSADDRIKLLGDRATDTVLAAPVSEVVLYDERVLSSGIGARGVNGATGSLYGDAAKPTAIPTRPQIDLSLFGQTGGNDPSGKKINEWIQALNVKEGSPLPDIRLFSMDRYSGRCVEVPQ